MAAATDGQQTGSMPEGPPPAQRAGHRPETGGAGHWLEADGPAATPLTPLAGTLNTLARGRKPLRGIENIGGA